MKTHRMYNNVREQRKTTGRAIPAMFHAVRRYDVRCSLSLAPRCFKSDRQGMDYLREKTNKVHTERNTASLLHTQLHNLRGEYTPSPPPPQQPRQQCSPHLRHNLTPCSKSSPPPQLVPGKERSKKETWPQYSPAYGASCKPVCGSRCHPPPTGKTNAAQSGKGVRSWRYRRTQSAMICWVRRSGGLAHTHISMFMSEGQSTTNMEFSGYNFQLCVCTHSSVAATSFL